MGSPPALHFIWLVRCIFATGSRAVPSALLPGFERADVPAPPLDPARRALQPALGLAIDVARQKVAARPAIVAGIGLGDRRHRAAGPRSEERRVGKECR